MTRVTPEFRDQVMSLWNADKTSTEIAATLHITRNAVIGIVQRFKGEKRKTTRTVILARQRAPRQPKPWTPPKSKRRQEPAVAPLVAAPAPMPVPAPLPTPPKPLAAPRLGRPCNIVDISSGCRWPIMEAEALISEARKALAEARECRLQVEAILQRPEFLAVTQISDRIGKIEKLAAEVRKLVVLP